MLRKTPDDNQRPPPVVLALMVSPFRGHGEKSLSLSLFLTSISHQNTRHGTIRETIRSSGVSNFYYRLSNHLLLDFCVWRNEKEWRCRVSIVRIFFENLLIMDRPWIFIVRSTRRSGEVNGIFVSCFRYFSLFSVYIL